MPTNDDVAREIYNRVLGNLPGGTPRQKTNYKHVSDEQVNKALRQVLGNAKAAKTLGNKSGGGSYKKSKPSKLTEEQKTARRNKFLKESGKTKEGNRSFFDKFKDVAGRTLNLVGRPGYAVTGALYEQAKAMAEGEPFWSTIDELGYGGWRGLSGQANEGGGDVLREYKKGQNYKGGGIGGLVNTIYNFHAKTNPLFPTFLPQAAAEVSNKLPPEAEKWFDRVAGGILEAGYDPTNVVSLGAVAKARNAIGLAGKEAVKVGTGNVVRDVVRASHGASIADDVVDAVVPKVDDYLQEISRGGQGGKVRGINQVKNQVPQLTGDAVRSRILNPVRDKMEQVLATAKGTNVSKNAKILTQYIVPRWRQVDPEFANVYQKWLDNVAQMTTAGKSLTPENFDDAFRIAFTQFSDEIAPQIDTVIDAVNAGLKRNLVNAPGIKFAGAALTSKKLGGITGKISEKLAKSPLDEMLKSLSYGRGNPGVALGFGGKTRSTLTHTFKKLFAEVEQRGKSVTRDDARIIQEALQDGSQLADPILEGHRAWLRQKYDEIFLLEVQYGLRDARLNSATEKARLNDYVYTHFKSSSKETRAYRDQMRAHVKKYKNYDGYTLTDAMAAGAKPETNAFNNLLARQIKANKDIGPIHFARQINENFGIKGTLSAAEIARRKLVEVLPTSRELPPSLAASLRPGEKMYLTQQVNEILERYRGFADIGSKEHQQLLHMTDYVTNKFKRLSTLYYPAFHIRNFVGDMWMGAIDGVSINDYIKIFNKWNKRATSTLKIAGQDIPFNELVELYEKNLSSSGHFLQEIDYGGALNFRPKRISGTIGDWAQKREDFGRFAHFTHALDEEMKHNLGKYTDHAKAYEKAVEAATFRVNKYKFDYSALTNLEQKYIKRVIPFYTYPRNAISTLAEASLISPKIPSRTSHIIQNWQEYAEKNNPGFDPIGMPGWMRDSPVIPFGGGAEPLGFDAGNLLPYGGATDWMQNPLANVNPLIRAVPELTYSENAFTHEDVKNPIDIFLQNLRPLSEYKRATKDTSGLVKISNFLGIPVRKISAGQQEAQVNSLIYKTKGEIHDWDDKAMKQGYHVTFSERQYDDKYGGVSVKIYDKDNDSLIAEFPYWNDETKAYLKKLLG